MKKLLSLATSGIFLLSLQGIMFASAKKPTTESDTPVAEGKTEKVEKTKEEAKKGVKPEKKKVKGKKKVTYWDDNWTPHTRWE
jgi:hypothetical protein